MKKEKKTKQKKTKKYKIWFVIMVVPILLSVLPITSFALFNVNINNNYLSSVSYTSNGLSYSQQTYTNDDTSIQFTLNRNADKVAITYNYGSITTEPITHINASFEVKNTENGVPVKRLSNETPVCAGYQLSGDTAEIVRYNLTITEYLNRYKYSIDSEVNIGIEQLTTVQFQFNIDSQSGTIDINYISITLTFGQSQEQVTVDLSGIESQLDNINEQINDLTTDKSYYTITEITVLQKYEQTSPDSSFRWSTNVFNIVDNKVVWEGLYTTERIRIRVDIASQYIKTCQINIHAAFTVNGDISNTSSTYETYVVFGTNPQPYYNSNFIKFNKNSGPNGSNYIYENPNVNTETGVIWIYLNPKVLSYSAVIDKFEIRINDVQFQIKLSAENAENAVSEYESIIEELYPDESELDSALNIPNDIISNIEDLEEFSNIEQYNNFSINVFNESPFYLLLLPICGAFMLMGFILFGKAR